MKHDFDEYGECTICGNDNRNFEGEECPGFEDISSFSDAKLAQELRRMNNQERATKLLSEALARKLGN